MFIIVIFYEMNVDIILIRSNFKIKNLYDLDNLLYKIGIIVCM